MDLGKIRDNIIESLLNLFTHNNHIYRLLINYDTTDSESQFWSDVLLAIKMEINLDFARPGFREIFRDLKAYLKHSKVRISIYATEVVIDINAANSCGNSKPAYFIKSETDVHPALIPPNFNKVLNADLLLPKGCTTPIYNQGVSIQKPSCEVSQIKSEIPATYREWRAAKKAELKKRKAVDEDSDSESPGSEVSIDDIEFEDESEEKVEHQKEVTEEEDIESFLNENQGVKEDATLLAFRVDFSKIKLNDIKITKSEESSQNKRLIRFEKPSKNAAFTNIESNSPPKNEAFTDLETNSSPIKKVNRKVEQEAEETTFKKPTTFTEMLFKNKPEMRMREAFIFAHLPVNCYITHFPSNSFANHAASQPTTNEPAYFSDPESDSDKEEEEEGEEYFD